MEWWLSQYFLIVFKVINANLSAYCFYMKLNVCNINSTQNFSMHLIFILTIWIEPETGLRKFPIRLTLLNKSLIWLISSSSQRLIDRLRPLSLRSLDQTSFGVAPSVFRSTFPPRAGRGDWATPNWSSTRRRKFRLESFESKPIGTGRFRDNWPRTISARLRHVGVVNRAETRYIRTTMIEHFNCGPNGSVHFVIASHAIALRVHLRALFLFPRRIMFYFPEFLACMRFW